MRTTDRKGQGATEYLLMLAAVLVIVAAAVYYVTRAGPTFTITPASGYPKVSDNTKVLFVADKVTPSTLESADTTLAVYKPDGMKIGDNTSDVTSGKTITITATEAVPADSELRITYKGSTVTFTISTK